MNLIFNASAGTGKTWQVTELYAALVLGTGHKHLPPDRKPVSPDKILLMTFTDNAAAELRERVSAKMIQAEQVALDRDDGEQADCARRVLRTLPSARISTIHAFCAGLLREYALELCLSPDFQTLEGDERNELLDEVIKAELFQRLENDPCFCEFCEGVSVLGDHAYSTLNTIRSLLEKAAGRGLDLSRSETLLPPPARTVTRQHFERIRNELETFDLPGTAAMALDRLNEALADFPDLSRIAALPKFGQAKKVKHLSDALAEYKDRFLLEARYEQQVETFRAFARCLSGCAARFTEAKRARDAVDFGDQLLLARDLLKMKKFDLPLFDWIIVDEVQDTSRVQCDVIEALWAKDTHLVICGDRKQSIYAWRCADPQVMPDLQKKMAQRGGLIPVPLKESYRSKDRLLQAVNELFSGLYENYPDEALEPVEKIGAVTDGEGPCVEFLMKDSDESTLEDEMAAVARRIRLLVSGDPQWCPKFGFNGKIFAAGERFRYGDILILLKRSTNQPVLEKALRESGIPYSSGGKGKVLFDQQEVRDLLLFLQVLCEPFNDMALAGLLRSPFANVPDEEFVRFGWNGETFDRDALRKQFFESGSEAAARLLRYREQTGEKLPSQLVRDIVNETAFDAHLAGQPGGAQKLANFKKALDWLRDTERGGQVLLPDVVRRFEKYIKTPPESGAAEALLPDPSQNAVTLMTVHGAKGLTKRVCFVPDISFGEKSGSGFAEFSVAGMLEMNITGLAGEKIKSPGWDDVCEANKMVREKELTNVFYVAMTRARDLVVLSGAGTSNPAGWLKMADPFMLAASSSMLRKLSFAEIPTGNDSDSQNGAPVEEVCYVPLQIPDGISRKTVTSLVRHLPFAAGSLLSATAARYGTAGHAVLEVLAKNNWCGDISEELAMLELQLSAAERAQLETQLEEARRILRLHTLGAEALLPEFSFVLRRGDLILDGTMDLLVQMPSNDWKILDYKFTVADPAAALELYAPQLAAYQEAVEALHPGSTVSPALVLIGDEVQILPYTSGS